MRQRIRSHNSARHTEVLREVTGIALADGMGGLTLDAIASRVRCSKSTLYSVAPSREQLAVAVLKYFFRTATERIEAAVDTCTRPEDKVAAYLAGIGREMRRGSARFHDEMATGPATAELYAANTRVAAHRVSSIIGAGVESGELRAANAEFVGLMVEMVIHGIHQSDLLAGTGVSPADAYELLSDSILFGLTGDPGWNAPPAGRLESQP